MSNGDWAGEAGAAVKGAAGAAGGLGGILSGVLGAAGPIGAIASAGMPILQGIIAARNRGKQKVNETKTQLANERFAHGIEEQLKNGTVDPDTALQQLQELYAQAPDNVYVKGLIMQIQGQAQQKRTDSLSADFTGNLGGTSGFQKERVGTLLRNRVLNTNLGQQTNGSPLARLTENPLEHIGGVQGASEQAHSLMGGNSNYTVPSTSGVGDTIKKRLAQLGAQ